MSTVIGTSYPVKIPTLADGASIEEAFSYYHTGGIGGGSSNDSIQYHFQQADDRIDTAEADIVSLDYRVTSVESATTGLESNYVKTSPSSNTTATQRNIIKPSLSSVIPLQVEGASGQTANLQEWRIDATTIRAKVDKDGRFYSYNGSILDEVVTLAGTQTISGKTLLSPSMTGTPTAPTATNSTNNTQVATTAFVKTAVGTLDILTKTSTYTLQLADVGKVIYSSASIYIPTNASVAFPIGSTISLVQSGSSTISVIPVNATVSINSTPGLRLRTQYSVATLTKIGTDTWLLFGDLMI